MREKTFVGWVCVIAMVLIVPMARGEILDSNDFDQDIFWGDHIWPVGGYFTSYVSGRSNGSDYDNLGGAWGANFIYTTEAGNFDWNVYLYAETSVGLVLWDGKPSYAEAWAQISCDTPHGSYEDMAHVIVEDADTTGREASDWIQLPFVDGEKNIHFDAMTGINVGNMVLLWITTHEGKYDYGIGSAEAQSDGTLMPSFQ